LWQASDHLASAAANRRIIVLAFSCVLRARLSSS
jgi:hypothetical protein